MIQLSLAFIILCTGLQYGAGNPVDEQTSYANSLEVDAWLRLHTEPAAFWDAHDTCQREGGVLASPVTDAMLQAMRTAMTDNQVGSSNVFVGIASQAKGKRSLSTFSHASLQWAADEPSNAVDEQCLALTGAGALADVGCDRAHPYFCRKEPARNCSDLSNGYEYEPLTGSCYKFHRIALAFDLALAACRAEGGTLSVINSATESGVLKEIFLKNRPNTYTGKIKSNYALVGFRKLDGEWATLHGDTLEEAGFSKWSSGGSEWEDEPNGDGNCGSIFVDGLLNDLSCTDPYAFICEITS